MNSAPAFFAQLINEGNFFLFYFNQIGLGHILGQLLKYLLEPLNIFLLNLLQHLFTLLVQVLTHIEVGFVVVLLLDFLFHFLHFFLAKSVKTQNIVQVLIIDMRVLLIISFLGLNELNMQLGTLLNSIIFEGPSRDDPEIVLAPFEFDDEVVFGLLHSFLQILDQLGRIITEVHIDPFRFCLQYSVFIPENKPHQMIYIIELPI